MTAAGAPLVGDDTAGAAREVAELGDPRHAALAPPAAAALSGLDVLRSAVEDDPDNTTRFVVLSKIESYQIGAGLNASRFYVEIEGHPDEPHVALALQELHFFSSEMRVLGVYATHPHRLRERAG